MIGDAFGLLDELVSRYDKSTLAESLTSWTSVACPEWRNLNVARRLKLAKDDLKQAEKLGDILAGHMANLSFAIQIMNRASLLFMNDKLDSNHVTAEDRSKERTAVMREDIRKHQAALEEMKDTLKTYLQDREQALRSREEAQRAKGGDHVIKCHEEDDKAKKREQSIYDQEVRIREKEAYIDELKRIMEELEVLQVNNTRKSDLGNHSQLKRYLESVIADITSHSGNRGPGKPGRRFD